ncbi:MAG: fibronectin type III domain-containing protein, partial [Acidimicrobiales bacterium]
RQGLVYDGLERTSRADPCRGAYRLEAASRYGRAGCTHGPDPAPPGVDVTQDRPPPPVQAIFDTSTGAVTAAAPAQVPCFGNGSDGFRVQLLYARASDKPDNYAGWLASFQQWAARIDDVFNSSAAETGGSAHVRFVHDASCVPVIGNVVLSTRGDDNIDNTINELRGKGYTRNDRRYIVWMESNVYCAIAEIWPDDSPGPGNTNNGVAGVPGAIGRVDKGCWGNTNLAEAHELIHTLGGVQPTAPNATPGFHCTDEYDRLCYNDGSGRFVRIVCGSSSHEALLDCNHDDYFSTNPPANSYLATHWNTAKSVFLSMSGSAPPPPTTTTTTTRPTTTTTTAPPSSSTTTTTTTTTTTVPPTNQSVPSAPQTLYATQPGTGGHGVLLLWSRPVSAGNPPFTTYRIYRGATSTNLTKLVDISGSATSYNDLATTPGALYWYYVKAVNTAGESPPSNLTRMVAK